jgi:hypothetical protein
MGALKNPCIRLVAKNIAHLGQRRILKMTNDVLGIGPGTGGKNEYSLHHFTQIRIRQKKE